MLILALPPVLPGLHHQHGSISDQVQRLKLGESYCILQNAYVCLSTVLSTHGMVNIQPFSVDGACTNSTTVNSRYAWCMLSFFTPLAVKASAGRLFPPNDERCSTRSGPPPLMIILDLTSQDASAQTLGDRDTNLLWYGLTELMWGTKNKDSS